MDAITNPFKPTAGAEPPRLIGREEIIAAFDAGLMEGCGAPARLMRITGPRGSGKTVLLTELGERARSQGWKVVDVTAGTGMLGEIEDELRGSVAVKGTTITGKAPFVEVSGKLERETPSLRRLIAQDAAAHAGLMITVDEVQDADRAEMQKLAAAIQHAIREKRDVALAFAGLTTGVMDLINGEAMTFLRRALPEDLALVGQTEIALSLGKTFAETGLTLEGAPLESTARATGGYPYMIQLVGFYVWARASEHASESPVVSASDVEEGSAIALERFHQTVHEPAISGLTKGAVDYLLEMAKDDGSSSTSMVAKRLGRTASAASSLRRTLIRRQLIEPTATGYVDFTIPFLREHLRSHRQEILARYGGE